MTIRETWRAAALAGTPQFYVDRDGVSRPWQFPVPHVKPACGITVLSQEQKEQFYTTLDTHPCPECAKPYWTLRLISHLNDVHRWTWIDLANKFPPILPEDQP